MLGPAPLWRLGKEVHSPTLTRTCIKTRMLFPLQCTRLLTGRVIAIVAIHPEVVAMSGSHSDELDFFTDRSFIADPYPYFDRLREGCPIQREPHHDVVMVTGYEAAVALFSDPRRSRRATR